MEKIKTPISLHCFVAGKSGGHILPALTKAKEFLAESRAHKVLFIALDNALDKKLLQDVSEAIIPYYLSLPSNPGKKLWRYPFFFYSFAQSFFKSLILLKRNKPVSIVSMGGLISIPVCLAGLLLHIPYHLYELNLIPGKAVKLLARWAASINICFKDSQNYFTQQCTNVAYPLQKTISSSSKKASTRKTILIIGGSQGSVFLNSLIKAWIERYPRHGNLFIMHQTGVKEVSSYKDFYMHMAIKADVFDYDPSIHKRYQQADLIICRSGAGTLFELAELQKPCITVPLPLSITDHQRYNAEAMSRHYSFIRTLAQEEIAKSQEAFFELVEEILTKQKSQRPD